MSTVLWKIKRKTKVNLWIFAETKTANSSSSTCITRVYIFSRKTEWSCHEPSNWQWASTDCSNQLEFKVSRSKKSNTETSITEENNDRPENNTPDNVLGSLLQSGIAGGKIERSRQILKSIQKNEQVSIDENNQNIFVDQQDTSINIIDFLAALQVNTNCPSNYSIWSRYLPFHDFCWQTLTPDRRIPEFRIGRCTENRPEYVSHLKLILPTVGSQSEFNFRQMAKKWFCGCCQKRLGKGSKTFPPLCTKFSKSRVVIENDDPFAVAYTKIHNAYTNPDNSTALGSREKLLRGTKCSSKHVDRYLNSSETYTKLKLTRKRFPRLKVVSYRLNEVWSIDLADMQHLATQNSGVRYLFVTVDTLSRFLGVIGVKSEISKACTDALTKIIATNRQRNAPKICSSIWADQGKEFAGNFSQFCKKNGIEIYYTKSEKKSAVAERYIRTLKSIICRYLDEHETNRFIDQLVKFVQS